MSLPIYNCLIDESLMDESGIYGISFVDEPANETSFVALMNERVRERLCIDRDKQILTGVVLRPEQLIYRNSPGMGEHYIKFSAEEIEKISHKMMRNSIVLQNTSHQHSVPLEGNFLIELWIVEDPMNDKALALGFEGLPKGTLMCSYKIVDRVYWESQVLSGNVKGFSLEGLFFQQETMLEHNSNFNKCINMNKKEKTTLFNKIARFFLDIEDVQKSDVGKCGTAYLIFRLADGKEVFVDADGFATLAGEQMPAGEHVLADGNLMVVDGQGQFVESKVPVVGDSDRVEKRARMGLSGSIGRRLSSMKSGVSKSADSACEPVASSAEVMKVLNGKVAEMELIVADIKGELELALRSANEARAEVESLRKSTPTASPLMQMHRSVGNALQLGHTERMAASLAIQFRRRN